eukprot:365335-Chlamydomonas_euryale.AAC.8
MCAHRRRRRTSKNVFQPRCGSAAATQLTPKLAAAPSPTSVFMSGRPAPSAAKPDARMSRPGPSSAATDSAAWNGGEWSACSHAGAFAHACARCARLDSAASAQANTRSRDTAASRASLADRLAASVAARPPAAAPSSERGDDRKPPSVRACRACVCRSPGEEAVLAPCAASMAGSTACEVLWNHVQHCVDGWMDGWVGG